MSKKHTFFFTFFLFSLSLTAQNTDTIQGKITGPKDVILKNVEITAQKVVIRKTAQGFIISANALMTQASGTATDVLRSTPTVVVDAEGAITLRGKTPLILINGRNSTLTNTDQIPASSIESIEVMNNPSAKYDAEAEGGIINIQLKKNKESGTNGAFVLGTGYGARGRLNSSILLNHKAGKWNIGLGYDNRFAQRIRHGEGDRVNFNIPEQYFLTQRRNDKRLEQTQNGRFNLDYAFNNKNTLGFEVVVGTQAEDNSETLNNTFATQQKLFKGKNTRHSLELQREKVFETAFNYNRKFEDKRKKLSIKGNSSISQERENTDITTQRLAQDSSVLGNAFLQRTHNYQSGNILTFRLDYTVPVSEKGLLETGFKTNVFLLNADFQTSDKLNDAYLVNTKSSNIFDFQEQTNAAYGQYKAFVGAKDNPKIRYEMGLRAEQTRNSGKGQNNTLTVDNQYVKLFPNANIAYFLKENEFFKIAYNRRINRPRMGQLNPFTDITDSLGQHGGNPKLLPELVHALEIGYNKEGEKVSLTSNLFYRRANNYIQQFLTLRPDGVLFTQPKNFGTSTTYGLENIVTVYPTKQWDSNLSVSFFQQNINGSNVSAELNNRLFSWYGKWINNFSLWKGSKFQVISLYNAPVATPQGKRVANYNTDFGFQQKILKDKGRFGLIVTDVFNTQRGGYILNTSDFTFSRIFKIDTRAILLTFAYTFKTSFKEDLMENQFPND